MACFLLGIQNPAQLASHPLKGALFESFVVAEMLKARFNAGQTDNLFYFRDNIGNEIDLICDHGIHIAPVEIKSGQTVSRDFFKGLKYFSKLTETAMKPCLVYGGDSTFKQQGIRVTSWRDLTRVGL